MAHPEHHLHARKRLYKNLSEFPHRVPWKRSVDAAVFFVGAVGPLFTLPQLTRIWIDRATDGLSLFTWAAYLSFSCLWFVYGVAHKEKPIMFANGSHIVVNALVVLGIILF